MSESDLSTKEQVISAETYYDCKIIEIMRGDVTTEVELQLKDSKLIIVLLMSTRRVNRMQLGVGENMSVFFVALSVIVAKTDFDCWYSSENVFRSKVTKKSVSTSVLNCELELLSVENSNVKFVVTIPVESSVVLGDDVTFDVIINPLNVILSKQFGSRYY